MKVKEASVTYGRKLQTEAYCMAHAEVSFHAEFDEGEDIDAAMRALWEAARSNVKAELSRIVPKIRADAGTTFLGVLVAEGSDNEKEKG